MWVYNGSRLINLCHLHSIYTKVQPLSGHPPVWEGNVIGSIGDKPHILWTGKGFDKAGVELATDMAMQALYEKLVPVTIEVDIEALIRSLPAPSPELR